MSLFFSRSFFKHLLAGVPLSVPLPGPPQKTSLSIPFLRRFLGPLFLILVTPVLVVMVWITVAHYDGSLLKFLQAGWQEWVLYIPTPSWYAISLILTFVMFEWFLLLILPGKIDYGPLTFKGNRPVYKYNGVIAWVVSHIVWFGIAYPLGYLDPVQIYESYGSIIVTLNLGAFLYCMLLYIKGRFFPSSSDTVYTGYFLFDFFQGIELYPLFAGTSLKQLINCRVSMMGWSSVFIICLLAQWEIYGYVSTSMVASVAVLVLYLFKFFLWERGYLHSMDIMHDRFGYYICWGVLVWVPSVYCLVALYLVHHPVEYSLPVTVGIVVLGILGIWVNYDADQQRRKVRDTQGKVKIWGKQPVVIRARYVTEDGATHENLLLASGWWGLARHFHYVPELILAVAWTLPVGFTHFLPWFYIFFLFILLMDRANRDEKKCAAKYGSYWKEYREKVPYKVWPYLY